MQRLELKEVPLKQVENYSMYNSFNKNEILHTLPLPTFGSARCSVAFSPLRPRPLNPLPLRKRPGTPNVSMFNFFSSAQVVLLKGTFLWGGNKYITELHKTNITNKLFRSPGLEV